MRLVGTLLICLCVGIAPATGQQLGDAYGDPLPPGAIARLGTVRFQQVRPLMGAGFSSDGRYLAGGTIASPRGGTIRIWETATGKVVHTFPKVKHSAHLFAWSPDGKLLYVAGHDGSFLYEVESEKLLGKLPLPHVRQATFSPDSRTLATFFHAPLLYDVATLKPLPSPGTEKGLVKEDDWPFYITFTPDGKKLITPMAHGDVLQWDVANLRQPERVLARIGTKAEETFGMQAIVGAGGKRAASMIITEGRDGFVAEAELRVADLESGTNFFFKETSPGDLLLSPDGNWLLHAGNGFVTVFDLTTGKQAKVITCKGYYQYVGAALSPDGKTLAVWGKDWNRGWTGVDLYDFPSCHPLPRREGLHCFPHDILLSDDPRNTYTLSFEPFEICRWDLTTGKPLPLPEAMQLGKRDWKWCKSGDGATLLLYDRYPTLVHVFNLRTGKLIRTWDKLDYLYDAVLSRDGTWGIFWLKDGVLSCRELATDRERWRVKGHDVSNFWEALVLSPDDATLVHPQRPDLVLLDAGTGKDLGRIRTHWTEGIGRVRFTPDSRWMITRGGPAGKPPRFRIDERTTGRERRDFAVEPGDMDAFSPDGRFLAIAGKEETVRVYEWTTGALRRVLRPPADLAYPIQFTPDSKHLATSHKDSTVLIWDLVGVLPEERKEAESLTRESANQLGKLLVGEDGLQADRAIRLLTARPELALPMLRTNFPPLAALEAKHVQKLIRSLDAVKFTERDQATRELLGMGMRVLPDLRRALTKPDSIEARQRLEHLIAELTDPGSVTEWLTCARAVELAERIGNKEARQLLHTWADGADEALLTKETRAALKRGK